MEGEDTTFYTLQQWGIALLKSPFWTTSVLLALFALICLVSSMLHKQQVRRHGPVTDAGERGLCSCITSVQQIIRRIEQTLNPFEKLIMSTEAVGYLRASMELASETYLTSKNRTTIHQLHLQLLKIRREVLGQLNKKAPQIIPATMSELSA